MHACPTSCIWEGYAEGSIILVGVKAYCLHAVYPGTGTVVYPLRCTRACPLKQVAGGFRRLHGLPDDTGVVLCKEDNIGRNFSHSTTVGELVPAGQHSIELLAKPIPEAQPQLLPRPSGG